MRLFTRMMTQNDCYRTGRKLVPRGIMVHSTGADNPSLCRYVPGDAVIGYNRSENHWDQSNAAWRERYGVPLNKCVHAFIGKAVDGSIATVQTLPWSIRGWHAGKGAGNDGYIGFEICEDGLEDAAYFKAIYREAVELTAMLCRRFGFDPMGDGVILCHAEGYRRGIASNHGDVLHWFPKHGKTMDDFRADVLRQLEGGEEVTQERFDAMLEDWLRRQGEKPASDWAERLLAAAKEKGITDGTRPQAFATRQEVAVMVAAGRNK